MLFGVIPPARSADITFPKDSKPALVIHLPDKWTFDDSDPRNILLTNADSTCAVTILVAGGAADAVKTPYDEFARQVFAATGTKKIDSKEETTFAGIKGMAYYTTVTRSDGSVLKKKLIIIYVDATHICTVTRVSAPDLDAAKLAEVDKVIATTQFVPAK